MKKLALSAILVSSLTVASEAAEFSDFDRIIRELTDSSSGRHYSSSFSVVNEDAGVDVYAGSGAHGPASFGGGLGTSLGYTQGPTITRAIASFGLWDNDTAKEQVRFSVGGITLGSTPGQQINGYNVYTFDLLALLTTPAALSDLADGTVSYRVSMANNWSNEDVWLKWAYFEIETQAASVPDGGTTLALLGVGVLGLAFAFRRAR